VKQLGWSEAANLHINIRWGEDNADRCRHYAAELLALGPDVLLGAGTPAVVALRRTTRIVPIVFVQITDPVDSGLVASLAKPDGNATGFMNLNLV
jgi:putative ABC transport system substrate-binding protein